ncbi:VCBS repeat-containing protein [candidate division WOR-3 bacterium]|nr:VCBS repeat-containing protein [candidate division WOR-3 bacterium]
MSKKTLFIFMLIFSALNLFSHSALFEARYDVYGDSDFYQVKYRDICFLVEDIDNDQLADVIMINPLSGKFLFLINQGNYDFSRHEFIAPGGVRFADIGDIDEDNDLDILYVPLTKNYWDTPDTIFIYKNDGNYNFSFESCITESLTFFCGFKLGDLDNDGDNDIFTMVYPARSFIYKNDGAGHYNFYDSLVIGDFWLSLIDIEIADLTNDSYDDVMFYNFGLSPDGLFVLRNNGAGSFIVDSFYEFPFPHIDNVIKVTDADGDGDNDVFLYGWVTDKLIYMINNGNGKFTSLDYFGFDFFTQNFYITPLMNDFTRFYFTMRSEQDYYSYKRKVYLFKNYLLDPMTLFDEFVSCEFPMKLGGGDFDGDGDIDYCVVNFKSGLLSIIQNRGDGKFVKPPQYQTGLYPQNIVARDFNGDGVNDVATANGGSDDFTVLFNDGQGGFFNRLSYQSDSSPNGICSGDFDGDGDQDVAVANYSSDNVNIFSNSGYGTFSSAGQYSFGTDHTNPFDINCGDLDGDGYLDLVVSLQGSSEISLLTNDGNGNFTVDTFYGTGQSPCELVIEDLSGDGFFDILVVNEFSNTVSIFTGDGQARFTLGDSLTGLCNPTGLVVCDFDGDSLKDIVVSSAYSNSIQVFKNLGSGNFSEYFEIRTGFEPWGIECADVDADGTKDIVTVNFKTNNLAVHYGNGDLTFSEAEFYGVDSAPSCMVLGDFNGNGGVDVITGHYTSDKISVLLSEITTGVGESPGYDNGDGGIKFELLTPNLSPGNFDLRLVISGNSHVTVEIYNILGQKVKTIVEGNLTAGTHLFRWERDDDKNVRVSDGVYFILMRSENITDIKKISLI